MSNCYVDHIHELTLANLLLDSLLSLLNSARPPGTLSILLISFFEPCITDRLLTSLGNKDTATTLFSICTKKYCVRSKYRPRLPSRYVDQGQNSLYR